MTAIKTYLLRLIFCGFLVSLCQVPLRGKRAGKLVALCGGCLLLLTAVKPLLQVDLSALPELMTGLTQAQRQAEAFEKNEALLQGLVEAQTVSWLETQAAELKLEVSFSVETLRVEDGLFIPYRVRVTGLWTPEQKEALGNQIRRELEIPAERQEWEIG
jgi:hypothetical protein